MTRMLMLLIAMACATGFAVHFSKKKLAEHRTLDAIAEGRSDVDTGNGSNLKRSATDLAAQAVVDEAEATMHAPRPQLDAAAQLPPEGTLSVSQGIEEAREPAEAHGEAAQ